MRWMCGIEYDGSAYYGWQRQIAAGLPTIEQTLETALAKIANHPLRIVTAGRTDAGVHATGQVIHFDTTAIRPERAWLMGTNRYLPPDIAIQWMHPVNEDFHARFSATARCYQYVILNSRIRHPLLAKRALPIFVPLDHQKMHRAAQLLVGKHDFSAFRAAQCQAKSPWREVQSITIQREGNMLITTIQANAFLQHMVRNIMGVLVAIGSGKAAVAWAGEVLMQRQRQAAGMTLPACGLYLIKVCYPAKFNII